MSDMEYQREGAELLEEYWAAMAAGTMEEVPPELDDRCHRTIRREFRRLSVRHVLGVAARAAVVAFAVLGLLSAAVLTIKPLRERAAAMLEPSGELYLEYADDLPAGEYQRISYSSSSTSAVAVYHNGADSYRIIFFDALGTRSYTLKSSDLDPAFLENLSSALAALGG